MKIYKRVILVLRRLQVDQYQTHSWLRVYALRKHSHMPVLNNNQNASKTQRLLFSTLNLSLKQKKITLKLELKIQMISKKLLMLNGILFMISLIEFANQVPRSFFQTCQLEI